ncbi:MAG TPA: transglutaminase family protein, partial [Chthoniobacterales bacterium]|nr:transglutaminase family protein [Chthoniobacterales bacterium]
YDRPVHFSPHEVRLFPRVDHFSRVRRLAFTANGTATVRYARDVFDNVVASCFFPEAMPELALHIEIDLELEEKDAFDFILESSAVEMPFAYGPELASVLEPYLQRQTAEALTIPGWEPPSATNRCGTVTALVGLNHAMHEGIGYERREEGAALAPAETLRLRRGACRDVAVLLAEVLRAAGLAARLVSGYLRETEMGARRAEGSLHAWTEVYLPGAGWVGMDGTNGVFCNHNFIAAAVGLRPADITPVLGSFYGDGKVESKMTSRLELLQL